MTLSWDLPEKLDQAAVLGVLSGAPAERVKCFVEELLPELEAIEVLQNRTGLVMLPMTESVQGTTFYLGEVLVAEARVRVGPHDGYAACLGRDLQQALAIAILDAALAADRPPDRIATFVAALAAELAAADDQLLRQVEATRVEMETF
jgi:alpha-D-ribose 1-methylphosphonate 5-triphosphate synthase subunit PhnG